MQKCFHRSVVFACWGISTEGRSTALLLRNMALRVSRSFPNIIQKHDSSTQTFRKACRVDFWAHKKSLHPGSDSGIFKESPWIFFVHIDGTISRTPWYPVALRKSSPILQNSMKRAGWTSCPFMFRSPVVAVVKVEKTTDPKYGWITMSQLVSWLNTRAEKEGTTREAVDGMIFNDIHTHHCSAAFIMAIPVVYCFCFFLNLKRRGADGQSHHYMYRDCWHHQHFIMSMSLKTYNDTNKRHSQQWHYQVSMLITYKSQYHNDNNHEIHQPRHDRQCQLSLPLTTTHEPLTHSPTTPHQTSTDSPTSLVSGGWNSWLSTLSQQLMQGSECHESRLLWRCFDGCLIYFHLVKLQAFRWRGRVCLCFDAGYNCCFVTRWITWLIAQVLFALPVEQWQIVPGGSARRTCCEMIVGRQWHDKLQCFMFSHLFFLSMNHMKSYGPLVILYFPWQFSMSCHIDCCFFLFAKTTCRAVFWKKFWEDFPLRAWLMWAMVVETFVLPVNFDPRSESRSMQQILPSWQGSHIPSHTRISSIMFRTSQFGGICDICDRSLEGIQIAMAVYCTFFFPFKQWSINVYHIFLTKQAHGWISCFLVHQIGFSMFQFDCASKFDSNPPKLEDLHPQIG